MPDTPRARTAALGASRIPAATAEHSPQHQTDAATAAGGAATADLAVSMRNAGLLFAELADMAEGLEAALLAILNGSDAMWPAVEALARHMRFLSGRASVAYGGDRPAEDVTELMLSPAVAGALDDAASATAAINGGAA